MLTLKANFDPYKNQVYIANLKSFSNASDSTSKFGFSKYTSFAFVHVHKPSFYTYYFVSITSNQTFGHQIAFKDTQRTLRFISPLRDHVDT